MRQVSFLFFSPVLFWINGHTCVRLLPSPATSFSLIAELFSSMLSVISPSCTSLFSFFLSPFSLLPFSSYFPLFLLAYLALYRNSSARDDRLSSRLGSEIEFGMQCLQGECRDYHRWPTKEKKKGKLFARELLKKESASFRTSIPSFLSLLFRFLFANSPVLFSFALSSPLYHSFQSS